jgi:hypothetical protein
MSKFRGDSDMDCVVLMLILAFALSFGLGMAAVATWMLSVLGIVEFTLVNTLCVWVLLAILAGIAGT